jgi:hypothetical protein
LLRFAHRAVIERGRGLCSAANLYFHHKNSQLKLDAAGAEYHCLTARY